MTSRVLAALLLVAAVAAAEEANAERGYRLLLERAYLPPDFDQETFDRVWESWPEPLRTRAAGATAAERRALAFRRYGLTPRPDDATRPLQYVVDDEGGWTMNCFACHGGELAGRVVPGLPNSHFALDTLTEEIRATKIKLRKPWGRMDLGSFILPLGTSNGTTNAVMFGVALLHGRKPDLKRFTPTTPPHIDNHDMDAPPWWHFRRKRTLYSDGFAPRGHRSLMQFLLVPQNDAASFRAREPDFRDVFAYLESLRPPRNPHEIDAELAARGRRVFEKSCARCHGSYGERPSYPEKRIPLAEVGTDPVRLRALTAAQRTQYAESWFAEGHRDGVVTEPDGYVAPPLDGIWASAPYLHNGSVPTLWHLLHPDRRPIVWKRTRDGYDRERVGLQVETFDDLPDGATDGAVRRTYFDTRWRGKSAAGHDFPAALTEEQRRWLLEYLKSL